MTKHFMQPLVKFTLFMGQQSVSQQSGFNLILLSLFASNGATCSIFAESTPPLIEISL